MRLDNKELHNFLKGRELHFLYHANTVSTSITYFEQNGLLSRGAIDALGLYQSNQSSDDLDKEFNVWDDVFVDTVDLHGYFPRQNLYGPVSFEFNVDLVLNTEYEIWVTKNNPIYWEEGQSEGERYFASVEELKDKWDTIERHRKMITIRSNKEPILFDHINKIRIDNPNLKIIQGDIYLFNETANAIKKSVVNNLRLKNKFFTRKCDNCFCAENYKNQVKVTDLKRLFLPKI